MHLNIGLTLTAASALLGMTAAAAIDTRTPDESSELFGRAVNEPWSFKAYSGTDCKSSSTTYSGNGQVPCTPPKPAFKSVLVTNLAGGNCIIAFSNMYNASKTIDCGNFLGSSPGVASINTCYNFPAGKIPTTFSTACKSSS